MKTFVTLSIIALFCCATGTRAQQSTLSPKMALFKEYCMNVRNGMERQDTTALQHCLAGFSRQEYLQTGGNFTYKGQTIALAPYDNFTASDPASTGQPLSNHLKFDPFYVDTLLASGLQLVDIETPAPLRSDNYDCKYIHQVIAAKGKCKYKSKGSGNKELFVVAENGGAINLTVRDPKNKVEVKDKSPNGKPSAEAIWKMPRFSQYDVEIENKSDKDISVIIVSN